MISFGIIFSTNAFAQTKSEGDLLILFKPQNSPRELEQIINSKLDISVNNFSTTNISSNEARNIASIRLKKYQEITKIFSLSGLNESEFLTNKFAKQTLLDLKHPIVINQKLLIDNLRRLDSIDLVQKNVEFVPVLIPNDPKYSEQFALSKLNMEKAWEKTTGKSTVRMGIIDTGVNKNHPDLLGRVESSFNFANCESVGEDNFGHGTKLASVFANSNNSLGIAGWNWNSKIIDLKVLCNQTGIKKDRGVTNNNTFALSQAIQKAIDLKLNILNMSFAWYGKRGTDDDFPIIKRLILEAKKQNIVIFAAGGNCGPKNQNAGCPSGVESTEDIYPASDPNVITIGATDSNDQIADFSSQGTSLDLVAPGVGIIATDKNGGYSSVNGTSISAPIVASIASLLLSLKSNLTSDEIQNILETSAIDLGEKGKDKVFGSGRIDPLSAICKVIECNPLPTAQNTITPIPTNSLPTSQPRPTSIPTNIPPSPLPSAQNSQVPTSIPSEVPTSIPSNAPTLIPSVTPNFCQNDCSLAKCPTNYHCERNETSALCYNFTNCLSPRVISYCASPISPTTSPSGFPSTQPSASTIPSPIATNTPIITLPTNNPTDIPSVSPTSTPTNTPSITPTSTPNSCGSLCRENNPYCEKGFFCNLDKDDISRCYNLSDCLPPDTIPVCPVQSPNPTVSTTLTPASPTPIARVAGCFTKCESGKICSQDMECIDYKANCTSSDPRYPECNYCYKPECQNSEGGISCSNTLDLNLKQSPTPAPISQESCTFSSTARIIEYDDNTFNPMTQVNKSDKEWYLLNNIQESSFGKNYQEQLQTGNENIHGFQDGKQIYETDKLSFPLYASATYQNLKYLENDLASVILHHPSSYEIIGQFCDSPTGNCPNYLPKIPNIGIKSNILAQIKMSCNAKIDYGFVVKKIISKPTPVVDIQPTKEPDASQMVQVTIENRSDLDLVTKISLNPCQDSVTCFYQEVILQNHLRNFVFDKLPIKEYTLSLGLPVNVNKYIKVTNCLGEIIKINDKEERCKVKLGINSKVNFKICSTSDCSSVSRFPSPPVKTPTPNPKNTSWKNCGTPGTNPLCCMCTVGICAVDNLVKYFSDDSSRGGPSARDKAIKASVICSRESGCGASNKKGSDGIILNSGCLTNRSCDYSVGPFQMNLLGRCPNGISYNCKQTPMCKILNPESLANCRIDYGQGENAIKKMVNLSLNGNRWSPWAGAKACNVN